MISVDSSNSGYGLIVIKWISIAINSWNFPELLFQKFIDIDLDLNDFET